MDMFALFWQFLFYSFCGFLLEILFARLIHHPKQDRKCHLLFPVCPVYGVGALLITLLSPSLKAHPFLLFGWGVLAATAAEWILSVFYERFTGVAFWDYRSLRWNLQGRVCLPFSLYWGLLTFPLVYVIQPKIVPVSVSISPALTIPAAILYGFDTAISIYVLRKYGTDGLKWYDHLRPFAAH